LGIWTLPQFAIPFLIHAGVLLIALPNRRRQILITVAVVSVASFAFYASVLDQLLSSAQFDFGLRPLPWLSWINGPYSYLARPTLAPFLPDAMTRSPLLVALYLAFSTLGVRWLWRRGERLLLLLLVVPPVGTYLALVIARVGFASRFSSYLLFHVITLLALGIVELWDLARSRPLRPLLLAIAAGLLVVAAHDSIEYTRTLPIEDVKRVKQIADASGADFVFTTSTRPFTLQYYFGKKLSTRASLKLTGFLPGPAWPG
jgi:hypothetical protein